MKKAFYKGDALIGGGSTEIGDPGSSGIYPDGWIGGDDEIIDGVGLWYTEFV